MTWPEAVLLIFRGLPESCCQISSSLSHTGCSVVQTGKRDLLPSVWFRFELFPLLVNQYVLRGVRDFSGTGLQQTRTKPQDLLSVLHSIPEHTTELVEDSVSEHVKRALLTPPTSSRARHVSRLRVESGLGTRPL